MRPLGMVMAVRRDDETFLYEAYLCDGRPVWQPINKDYVEAQCFPCYIGAGHPPVQDQIKRAYEQQDRYEEVIKEAVETEAGVGFRSYNPDTWERKETKPLRPSEGTPERQTGDRPVQIENSGSGTTAGSSA